MGRFLLLTVLLLSIAQTSLAQVQLRRPAAAATAMPCTDNEIVVALQSGQHPGTLRAYNLRHRSISERFIAQLPVRIESIDIGKVYPSGAASVVAGLARSYPGSTGAVRVYTFSPASETWNEEALGAGIINNVEALTIGDADNDGLSDIVIGLEGADDLSSPRVVLFSHINGSWVTQAVSDPSWQRDVQYVDIVDLDNDGRREVVVLSANWTIGPLHMEMTVFRREAQGWTSSVIAQNVGGYRRAERFAVANIDGDADKEIIVGAWGPSQGFGRLYALDRNGSSWDQIPLTPEGAWIDAIGVGDLTADGRVDILYGDANRLMLLEQTTGGWAQHQLANPPVYLLWDADMGDADNDGRLDGIAAADTQALLVKRLNDGSFETSPILSMPTYIDSVQIGDVDGVLTGCHS